ncbi:MAG: glycosyltransferase family 2 protein [Candidatus Cloacimonetes bacterium]|nr:glycosyltransferase family 2 protein [Candidatus Cloacimonadota bacterium]
MLSVLIVTHDHDFQWPVLLNSLKDQASRPEITVYLLHNLPSAVPLPELPFKIYSITNTKPTSLSKNHNQLISRIDTEFTLILNPDTKLPKNCLEVLLKHIKNYDLLSCPAYYPDGTIQPNARFFPSVKHMLSEKLIHNKNRLSEFKDILSGTQNKFWIHGSLWLIRSVWLHKLKFCEQYRLYCEDLDFCHRLYLEGGKIGMCKSTWFEHNFNRQSRRNPLFAYWHLQSLYHYFQMAKSHPLS